MATTTLHDELVRSLLVTYQGMGLTILEAAIPGWAQPSKQGRHAPDLLACASDGLYRIGEAKVGNGGIGSRHSREQYQDFANRVMSRDGRQVPFDLVVPKRHLDEARRVLSSLGLLSLSNVYVWTA